MRKLTAVLETETCTQQLSLGRQSQPRQCDCVLGKGSQCCVLGWPFLPKSQNEGPQYATHTAAPFPSRELPGASGVTKREVAITDAVRPLEG